MPLGRSLRIPPKVGTRLLIAAILSGTLSVLDSTLVVPLLYTIGQDLGGGSSVSWLIAVYLLVSTVTVPLWGRWIDARGERAPMWVALALFTSGTALAALAPSLEILVAARVVQGVGAGGLIPLGQAILALRCSTEERARMQVYYNISYGAAAGLGPLIGGALVGVSWRWAFVLVLPFAVLTAVLLRGRLSTSPRAEQIRPFDYAGSLALLVGLTLILLAIERTWWWAGVIGAVALAFLARRSRRNPDCVIPERVIRHPRVLLPMIVVLLSGFLTFIMLTFLPQYSLKVVPDVNSGLVVIPITILWMTMGAFTGILALRIGFRLVAVVGSILGALSAAVLAVSVQYGALLIAALLAGAFAGLVLMPMLLLAQHSVDKADVGVTTSLLVLVRNFGGAAGAAVGAVLIADIGTRAAFTLIATVVALAILPSLALPDRLRG